MFEVKIEDHPIDLYIAPDRYEDLKLLGKGLKMKYYAFYMFSTN